MIPPQSQSQSDQTTQTQAPSKPIPTDWLVLGAPFFLQVITLTSIILIVLVRDGTSTDTVITALLTFLIGNTITGGAIGVTHTIANARVRQTAVQETAKIVTDTAVKPPINGVS